MQIPQQSAVQPSSWGLYPSGQQPSHMDNERDTDTSGETMQPRPLDLLQHQQWKSPMGISQAHRATPRHGAATSKMNKTGVRTNSALKTPRPFSSARAPSANPNPTASLIHHNTASTTAPLRKSPSYRVPSQSQYIISTPQGSHVAQTPHAMSGIRGLQMLSTQAPTPYGMGMGTPFVNRPTPNQSGFPSHHHMHMHMNQALGYSNPTSGNGIYILSTHDDKSSEASSPGTLTPESETDQPNTLNQLPQHSQELGTGGTLGRHGSPILVQVLHYIVDDGMDENPSYLSEPVWYPLSGDVVLRSQSHILNPREHTQNKGNVSFIIHKRYSATHQLSAAREALAKRKPCPKPEPVGLDVQLVSDEMIEAMKAFFDQDPAFRKSFPEVDETKKMLSPYAWWYHCRKANIVENLSLRHAELRGRVSNEIIEYLIRPGDVLVSANTDTPRGYLAMACPQKTQSEGSSNEWSWSIKSRTIAYASDFHWVDENVAITFESGTENGEVDMTSLNVVPLKYVSDDVRDKLKLRGEIIWKCRNKQLISYEKSRPNWMLTEQRFMIDFETYNQLHPRQPYLTGGEEIYQLQNSSGLDEKEVYLFPALVPGFDLRRKIWTDLHIELIRDVVWNEEASKDMVADEDTKELILALVTSQATAETDTELMETNSNGFNLLLYGSSGTGKTSTAELIAEMAKKPLFLVTCGDLGVEPGVIEKNLQTVLYYGRIWDCVVVLDEADIFLKRRTLNPTDDALFPTIRRVLEQNDGILVLTGYDNDVEDALSARIHVKVHCKDLEWIDGEQVWRNSIDRLQKLGEQDNIDFEDIRSHIKDLAYITRNRRDIGNSIKMARRLAKLKKRKMTFEHLEGTIIAAGNLNTME
ncbi:hypothetical protein M426DRAFT_319166 [Hypoxylon sp. CI-4A]|nr:hypothetical protein M426DRAFT_319166 [Hypoxylon sp. CI-4A]